jgi:PAS domain S-box-containing protein
VRILVADDHEVIRRGVCSLLAAGRGVEICGEAVDGQDAVEKAHQLHPDLVIMDVSMPNLNGLEATRVIRRNLPDTQILILTQHDSQEMMRQALNAGARGFVVKSSVAHDLLNAVEAAQRGESFFDSAVAPQASPSGPADAKTILEREAALEQALRDSEQRYRALSMATDQIVWRCDAAGSNVWTSENWKRIGGSVHESAGKGWLDLLHPDDRERVARKWQESVQAGGEYHDEFRLKVRDGSYRHYESRAVPVLNPNGTVREWIGANVDITERKRVEQELRASEHRRRMALSAAHVGGIVWDPSTGESELTPELQEIFGFEPGSARRGNSAVWLSRVHKDDRGGLLQGMKESESSGKMEFEFRYDHSHDGPRWLYLKGQLRSEEPEFESGSSNGSRSGGQKVYGVILDITERKKAEEELSLSQQRLMAAMAASRTGTYRVDPQTNTFLHLGENFRNLLGLPSSEGLSSCEEFLKCVHPEDLAAVRAEIARSRAQGEFRLEYRVLLPDGRVRWLYDRGQCLPDPITGATCLVGACTDITERKEAEQEVKLVYDELEARVHQRTRELRAAEAGLRHLSGRLMQLQDEERRRISRELHDSSGQALAALAMCLSMVEREKDKLTERAGRNLSDATRLVRELSQEVRTMSHLLHPPLLDEAGLESALRWFVEGFAQRSGVNVDLDLSPELGRLSKEMEIAIFRIVQESLANVHRHSGSKTAQVHVARDAQKVTLEVRDQGRGAAAEINLASEATLASANLASVGPALPGVGIQGMRERVRQLCGNFEVQSADGGTLVRAEIPVVAAEINSPGKIAHATSH